mgnify:CR=1 FL=1
MISILPNKALLVIVYLINSNGHCFANDSALNEPNQHSPKTLTPLVIQSADKPASTQGLFHTRKTISAAETSSNSSNLTDLITAIPSVSENGQGGHYQNFSIRGVSKHRIKTLINGMRIESDRRAGVSASFIDPLLIDQITVWRNPVSTQFGSGALGGAVDMSARQFDSNFLMAGYQTEGNENYQVVGTGDENWSFGFARRKADNAESADGNELNTHFTQYSAVLDMNTEWQGLDFKLFALPSIARDIGKSNTDFPKRTTNYPEEKHLLVKLDVISEAGWKGGVYLHPNDLETEVHKLNKSLTTVSNEALDFGANWQIEHQISDYKSRVGLDYFSRHSVNSQEKSLDLLTQKQSSYQPLVDGEENEISVLADLSGTWNGTEWQLGGRFSYFNQSASQMATREDHAWSGFLALSHYFEEGFELTANVATGFRFPSLSERFFSGTTGRGEVVANSNLEKEQSVNIDLGARWQGADLTLGSNIFFLTVSDYIERVEIANDVLTYVNLNNGEIKGVEVEADYYLTDALNLSVNAHYLKGEGDDGKSLADIPSNRLIIAAKYNVAQWETQMSFEMRENKDDIASGEKEISSAQILSAAIRYKINQNIQLSLNGSNLLNQRYYNSADRKSSFAKARSVGISFSWKSHSF